MTDREPIRVDPNTAELEGLYQIPGVGPTMAERILEARPFEGAEDLRRVSGIGPTVLERMSPFLVPSFARSPREVPEAEATDDVESSSVSEAQVVEVKAPERSSIGELSVAVGGEDEAEEALPMAADEPPVTIETLPAEAEAPYLLPPESETKAAEGSAPIAREVAARGEASEPSLLPRVDAAPSPRPESAPQRGLTRVYVGWMVGVGGLLALILALALSLGVLATLNGGQLQFVRPAEFGELQVQVEGLGMRADVLDQDVASLRTRLSNLEALGARVGDLEQVAEKLQSDLDAAESSVESLTGQVSDLQGEMTDLTGQLDKVRSEMTDLTEQLDQVSGEMEALQSRSERVEAFFDGLRDLVNGLFQPEGGMK